jgi:ActR/RegA family two-component response regulator/HAMP domain-containing protein
MKWTGSRPVPWAGWNDFVAWAASFSLRQKALGGFLGVAVLVGLGASLMGTWLARDMIMNLAKKRLSGELTVAESVIGNIQQTTELKMRLIAAKQELTDGLSQNDLPGLRNFLALIAAENDLDYLTFTDASGQVVARAFGVEQTSMNASSNPLVSKAIQGAPRSGILKLGLDQIIQENPKLKERISNNGAESALVIEAAQPVANGSSTIGVLYGGIALNSNNKMIKGIEGLVFKNQRYKGKPIGYATIYESVRPIASSAVDQDFKSDEPELAPNIQQRVLSASESVINEETRQGISYITATGSLKDVAGNIVGSIQLASLVEPTMMMINKMVASFLLVALIGALLMAAITYYLVQWISKPLDNLLKAARAVGQGDLSHKVPVHARDELGEVAASFNLMIKNLAESREKLEEWGLELASKVAAQTGQLQQAQEQVARVKKLASLEKMADGMAHHLAHISDPLGAPPSDPDEESDLKKILVFDQDEKVLEMTTRVLDNEGFDVVSARSSQEALKELQEDLFDIVIAQVDPPDISGKEFLKEIKYRQPEVLVIFTAPFKSTEDAVEAVKLGAFDYLPKPFGPHQIMLMVYTSLQTRAAVESTKKQLAEQRAEKIFQRLPVAIALADGAHRVVYHNKAFIDLASGAGIDSVTGKSFKELFGVDPLDSTADVDEGGGSRWLELDKVGRTAKLYNFKLLEEDLRVLMLLDITETIRKDKEADVFKAETLSRAQQVIHQQMRVAQEIAGLLGETTAETKAALFELIQLAGKQGESR